MIKELHLSNFKCYIDIDIPFAPLTVLTGINSIGKSTCIQALLMLRQTVKGIDPFTKIQSVKNYGILNGELVTLGMSDDVFNDDAKETDAMIIEVDNNKYQFFYKKQQRYMDYTKKIGMEAVDDNILFSDQFLYLSAERIGPKESFQSNFNNDTSINVIGNKGEYAPWLLAQKSSEVTEASRCLSSVQNNLISQVEVWMSEMGKRLRIHCLDYTKINTIGLEYSFEDNNRVSRNYRTTEVGFGLTYSLPIFIAGLSIAKGGMLIVENPEAHLHPKAQSLMGQFLAVVAQSGVQVVVETHSDHVLNGIRLAAKHKKIDADKVAIDFFSRDGDGQPELITPRLAQNGKLDVWPEEFFDEYDKNIMELI